MASIKQLSFGQFQETDQEPSDDPHQLPADDGDNVDPLAVVNTASGPFLEEPMEITTILYLDDYLLIGILKQLKLVDLSAMAMACKRTYAIARIVFNDVHRSRALLLMSHQINSVLYGQGAESHLRRVLHCFGDLIVNVNLMLTYDAQEMQFNQIGVNMLNLLVNHCSGRLKSITLSTNDVAGKCDAEQFQAMVDTKSWLSIAKHIKLENWIIHSSALANCQHLKTLTAINCRGLDVQQHNFPKLVAIKFEAIGLTTTEIEALHGNTPASHLNGFLQRHQLLRMVNLQKLNETMLNVSLPHLVKLKISKIDIEIVQLRCERLTCLKTRVFDRFPLEFFDQCENTLKYLSIRNGWRTILDDEYAHKLAKCSQVETLKVYGEINLNYLYVFNLLRNLVFRGPIDVQSEQLIELVAQLPNLRELIFDTLPLANDPVVKFKETTFLAFSEIYRHRHWRFTVKNDPTLCAGSALAFGNEFVEIYEQNVIAYPFYYFL